LPWKRNAKVAYQHISTNNKKHNHWTRAGRGGFNVKERRGMMLRRTNGKTGTGCWRKGWREINYERLNKKRRIFNGHYK
jgi:hypothetical protein